MATSGNDYSLHQVNIFTTCSLRLLKRATKPLGRVWKSCKYTPLWKPPNDVVFPDGLLISHRERPWLSEVLSTYNSINKISAVGSKLRTDFVKLSKPCNIHFAEIAFLVTMLYLQFPWQQSIQDRKDAMDLGHIFQGHYLAIKHSWILLIHWLCTVAWVSYLRPPLSNFTSALLRPFCSWFLAYLLYCLCPLH